MIPIKILPLFGSILLLTASCVDPNISSNPTPTQPTTEPTVVREIDPIQHTRKRTLEAWQAMQKADGEAHDALSNPLNFQEISTIQPYFQSLNLVATAYSQIDLTDVDPLLASHIPEAMNAYLAYSTALKAYYLDLSSLAKQLNGNVELAKRLGNFVALSPGGDAAEFLTRIASDDYVKKEKAVIEAKHNTTILETKEKKSIIAQSEPDLAKQLTEKYGTPFLDPF